MTQSQPVAPDSVPHDEASRRSGGSRRPLFGALLAFSIFLGIVLSTHAYFVKRLVLDPQWPPRQTFLASGLFTGLAVLLCVMPFAIRRISASRSTFLAWPGYTWMGTAFYLLLLLPLSDLLLWLAFPSNLEVLRARALWVLGATGLVVGGGALAALRTPSIKEVQVRIPGWPQALAGYRLLQLSDIHIGPVLRRGFAQRVTERCNAARADLIVITGDAVDGSVAALTPHVAPFGQLKARDGAFFITGNHDHYAGAAEWVRHWQSLGLRTLTNQHAVLATDRSPGFVLGGVHDRSSRQGDDVGQTFAGAPVTSPRLLLAHHPETFHKACKHGVDLQLSGHTHDGQLWPFRYLVHLQTHFVAGLYRQEDHQLYVSRGTGFWGPPLRVGAPAEITLLILNAEP